MHNDTKSTVVSEGVFSVRGGCSTPSDIIYSLLVFILVIVLLGVYRFFIPCLIFMQKLCDALLMLRRHMERSCNI